MATKTNTTMEIKIRHIKFQMDKGRTGGRILVSINANIWSQKREFSYGDRKFDNFATEKEARKATILFCEGAQMMFEIIKDQLYLRRDDVRNFILETNEQKPIEHEFRIEDNE